jgi:predicted CXXCH cytochrome family protein
MLRNKSGLICIECHEEVNQEVKTLPFQHKPMTSMECIACHQAHGSQLQYYLKRTQPDLCLYCHAEVASFWVDGAAHAPAKEDCNQCHTAHGSKYAAILAKSKEALCADCHEIDDSDFVKVHKGIKPGVRSCLGCHSPHGGPDDRLLHPLSHSPFKEGNCRPCHPGGAQK